MNLSSDADANSCESWLKLNVRTGHSKRENVRRQLKLFTSHSEANASTAPVAK